MYVVPATLEVEEVGGSRFNYRQKVSKTLSQRTSKSWRFRPITPPTQEALGRRIKV
jgi:hypothetical protein